MSGRDAVARDPGLRAAAFLAQTVPPLLASEGCRPDVCIVATEVCCRAGRALGLDVRPQAVVLDVWNPPATDWILRHRRPPRDRAETFTIPGYWSIRVGEPTAALPGRWPGHLVAVVHGGRTPVVLDPTLPQADRPKHGIALPPGVFALEPSQVADWFAGRAPAAFELNRCALFYRALDRTDYLTTLDWARPTRARLTDADWRARWRRYRPGTPVAS